MSITQVPEITELARPSLACLVPHPFGLTLGAVGERDQQRRVLVDVLEAAYRDVPAGSVVDLGYRWDRDDEYERQLRNESP